MLDLQEGVGFLPNYGKENTMWNDIRKFWRHQWALFWSDCESAIRTILLLVTVLIVALLLTSGGI